MPIAPRARGGVGRSGCSLSVRGIWVPWQGCTLEPRRPWEQGDGPWWLWALPRAAPSQVRCRSRRKSLSCGTSQASPPLSRRLFACGLPHPCPPLPSLLPPPPVDPAPRSWRRGLWPKGSVEEEHQWQICLASKRAPLLRLCYQGRLGEREGGGRECRRGEWDPQ